ncbi:hypothetical protein BSL78_11122 [Apostichopus japonicus]|uniref:Uncharacterized protein n=1 Tax=Stichopus japonicus TaxID=307972 RepID=A0A2G8KVD3_STIJA|nr:hypothetical protein BSL78_11122 [Apostichopus japonicus]
MKTPTHGILKSGDTASAKKRSRVMFAPDKPTDEEDGTDSDSSTSQLMEIELDEVPFPPLQDKPKKKQVPSQTVTPIHVRPSPFKYGKSSLKEKNLQLVPPEKTYSTAPQHEGQSEKANTRKTPKKTFCVKSWGDSPYRKKKKRITTKTSKKKDVSWFENDAVFGFIE